jgi:hypothetical protein
MEINVLMATATNNVQFVDGLIGVVNGVIGLMLKRIGRLLVGHCPWVLPITSCSAKHH